MLDDVSLIHMNGRVYDPDLGRFLSADPFIQQAANPQSFNRYSYVGNNPLSFTDPSGFFFKKLFKGIGKVFKGIGKLFTRGIKRLSKQFVRGLKQVFSVQTLITVGAYFTCGPTCAAAASAGYTASGGGSIIEVLHSAVQTYNTFQTIQTGEISDLAATAEVITTFAKAIEYDVGKEDVYVEVQRQTRKATLGNDTGVYGGVKFLNGAVGYAFSALFRGARAAEASTGSYGRYKNIVCNGQKCIGRNTKDVLRRTDRSPRVIWEGIENVRWKQISIDGIIQIFFKIPLPELAVRWGIEYGHSEYEYQIGRQEYQYEVEGLGVTRRTPIGDLEWTNETIWRRSEFDTMPVSRTRIQGCVAGSCGPN